MTARRIRLAAVPLLAASLLLAGCAGTGSDSDSAGQTPSLAPTSMDPQEKEFHLCLEKHGVVLEENRDQLRVNKDEGTYDNETYEKAQEQCADLLPSPAELQAVAREKAERLADCMREQGVKDYPEPDPETGDVEFNGDERADPTFRAAMTACQEREEREGEAADR